MCLKGKLANVGSGAESNSARFGKRPLHARVQDTMEALNFSENRKRENRGNEKTAASDEIWWNFRRRRGVHRADSEDYRRRGKGK
ncbi:MAG: hypothetical protein PVS2B2_14970 [Candidatus Acidiferrum sp.]